MATTLSFDPYFLRDDMRALGLSEDHVQQAVDKVQHHLKEFKENCLDTPRTFARLQAVLGQQQEWADHAHIVTRCKAGLRDIECLECEDVEDQLARTAVLTADVLFTLPEWQAFRRRGSGGKHATWAFGVSLVITVLNDLYTRGCKSYFLGLLGGEPLSNNPFPLRQTAVTAKPEASAARPSKSHLTKPNSSKRRWITPTPVDYVPESGDELEEEEAIPARNPDPLAIAEEPSKLVAIAAKQQSENYSHFLEIGRLRQERDTALTRAEDSLEASKQAVDNAQGLEVKLVSVLRAYKQSEETVTVQAGSIDRLTTRLQALGIPQDEIEGLMAGGIGEASAIEVDQRHRSHGSTTGDADTTEDERVKRLKDECAAAKKEARQAVESCTSISATFRKMTELDSAKIEGLQTELHQANTKVEALRRDIDDLNQEPRQRVSLVNGARTLVANLPAGVATLLEQQARTSQGGPYDAAEHAAAELAAQALQELVSGAKDADLKQELYALEKMRRSNVVASLKARGEVVKQNKMVKEERNRVQRALKRYQEEDEAYHHMQGA